MDFIKVHTAVPRPAYFALLRAAQQAGLQVVGHIPTEVEPAAAIEAGHGSIEHVVSLFEGPVRRKVKTGRTELLGGTNIYPGFSVHDELHWLVQIGFTPLEVLTIATRNSAESLGRLADLGTIEPGKRADLVLLQADPLADIMNTRRIAAVVADGRVYRKSDIEALLAAARHFLSKSPRDEFAVILPPPRSDHIQSCRRAISGSTLAARHAGSVAARRAVRTLVPS